MTGAGAVDLDELLDPERFAPHRLAQLDVAVLRVALEARRRGLRTVLSGPTFAHLRPTWSADVAGPAIAIFAYGGLARKRQLSHAALIGASRSVRSIPSL